MFGKYIHQPLYKPLKKIVVFCAIYPSSQVFYWIGIQILKRIVQLIFTTSVTQN